MRRQSVNFSANEMRVRKVIDNDSIRLNKIQFFSHFYPTFPLHQGPACLTILVCYCKKHIDISFLYLSCYR